MVAYNFTRWSIFYLHFTFLKWNHMQSRNITNICGLFRGGTLFHLIFHLDWNYI